MKLLFNKERFIIVAGVKEWEWESVPSGVAGRYVGPWFVGSVCEASSSVFFSDGVPSGISSSDVREVCLCCWLMVLCPSTPPKKELEKNSSWEEEGINALCQLIGQWVTESLGEGIDSRKKIDLWLLHFLPSYETCSIKVPFILAAIKPSWKPYGIFVNLLYFLLNIVRNERNKMVTSYH